MKYPKKGGKQKLLQTKWRIDEFLYELLELGIDYSLELDANTPGVIKFIIRHRTTTNEMAILRRCLISSFGVTE